MKFTSQSIRYRVDTKARHITAENQSQSDRSEHRDNLSLESATIPYTSIVGVYNGSPSVELFDENGATIWHIEGPITGCEGVPADEVTGEEGNLVVRTENSAYEFDQEQKLMRRLAGTNDPTNPLYPDGEWRPYDRIEYLAVGHRALIVYPSGKGKLVSTVRDIHGTYIAPPATVE